VCLGGVATAVGKDDAGGRFFKNKLPLFKNVRRSSSVSMPWTGINLSI